MDSPVSDIAYNILRLAQRGLEDEVIAAFPWLAASDQGEMPLACEYVQVNRFMRELDRSHGKRSGLRWKQKLNFFRLAQRIRDEHGTSRKTSPPNSFQSFEDIVELERNIETHNCVEFMIQCLRLDLVDDSYVDQMFEITSTVEQLAALYDEIVSALKRYRCRPFWEKQPRPKFTLNQLTYGERFQIPFRNLIETRQCKRIPWRDIKMHLERAASLEASHWFPFDGDIPDADLDEALSCLLSNAEIFTYAGRTEYLAHLSRTLLSRGASLYHKDQHGVSSLRRLLGLGEPHTENWPIETLSRYICCPLKKESGKIMADNRQLAPFSCLAAKRIPPSAIEEKLPSQLRLFLRGHRELQGVLTGSIQRVEPVDGWRGFVPYEFTDSDDSDDLDDSDDPEDYSDDR